MADELVLIVKRSRKGHPTPWLDASRARFKAATKEAAAELKGSNLKGAQRVVEFNRRVAQKLRSSAPARP